MELPQLDLGEDLAVAVNLARKRHIFVIYGEAGTVKTLLLSIIIEDLRSDGRNVL